MSCSEFIFSPRGREGVGVIQPQSGLDYPFVNPSDDIRYLVADFYFSQHADTDYAPDAEPIEYPLRIHRLYNVGCVENTVPATYPPRTPEDEEKPIADIVILDAADNVIFDTTDVDTALLDETIIPWGNDYTLYTWRTHRKVCRLLAYTTWLSGLVVVSAANQTPANGTYLKYGVHNYRPTYKNTESDWYIYYDIGSEQWIIAASITSNSWEWAYTAETAAGVTLNAGNNDSVPTLNWVNNTGWPFPPIVTIGAAKHYDKYLAPESAVLDSRSTYRVPKNVLSLSVRNGTQQTLQQRGNFIFRNGYNTEIVASSPTVAALRRTTQISLNAIPGTGTGKYPCATQPEINYPIKSINGITPKTAGHFLFSASDCLWIRRTTVYTADNPFPAPQATTQQQIGADCKPCCSCEEYAATAMYMNYTRDRYKLIGQRATDVKSAHEINVTRWNAYRQCTIRNPLKIAVVPQRAPFVDVAVMVCNNCEYCLPASTLQLVISVLNAETFGTPVEPLNVAEIDATVVCGYTEVYFPGLSAKTITINKPAQLTYLIPFPQLKSGDSGYVKFRLEFSARAKIEIQTTLTGTFVTGKPIPLDCGIPEPPATEPTPAIVTSDFTLDFHLTGIASRLC